MYSTEVLAEWAARVDGLPDEVTAIVSTHLLDTIGAAVAGVETANARAVRAAALTTWGSGKSPIWFTDHATTSVGASFVNAAAACALDLDDGHRDAAGHPGAAIIPAVLAAADEHDGDDIATAIAVGYDIGVRISAARDLRRVPTTNTGIWAGQAVAAAVGKLRGLLPHQIAHAIAISGITAPNQLATSYTSFRGNHVKEGIPWAAANGIHAVGLAENGFTGPIDILDNEHIYERERLLGELGERWSIQTAYIKPYSCCRWVHAPIDALTDILSRNKIEPADILGVHIETFSRTLTLSNEVTPATVEGAQYSLPFCIGLAAVRGPDALLVISEADLGNEQARDLAHRVTWSVDPNFDAAFPAETPGRVTVRTVDSEFTRTVTAPRGEWSNPLSRLEVEAKFRTICHPGLAADTVSNIIEATQSSDGIRRLPALIGTRQPTPATVPSPGEHPVDGVVRHPPEARMRSHRSRG